MTDTAALHAEIALLKQALAVATASLQDMRAALGAETAAGKAPRCALPQGLPDVPVGIDGQRAPEAAAAANRAKDESIAMKDALLGMLGHELRNPLNAIAAAVEVLNRTEARAAAAISARRIIGTQTRQLASMIDRLLDAGQVLSDTLVLQPQPLDLSDCVQRAAASALADAEAKGQHLHTILRTRAAAWVHADAGRLAQVLDLLLSNAIKYTPAVGRIELELAQDGLMAVLRVTHSGRIETALLARIFDPSVKGERSLARQDGSLGLGLRVVRRLVELHGGSVRACTGEDGSVFDLRLPLITAPGAALPATR